MRQSRSPRMTVTKAAARKVSREASREASKKAPKKVAKKVKRTATAVRSRERRSILRRREWRVCFYLFIGLKQFYFLRSGIISNISGHRHERDIR